MEMGTFASDHEGEGLTGAGELEETAVTEEVMGSSGSDLDDVTVATGGHPNCYTNNGNYQESFVA